MPHALMEREAVRVARQARDRLNVVRLTVDGFADSLVQVAHFFRVVEFAIAFFPCPLFHVLLLLYASLVARARGRGLHGRL